MLQRMKSKKVVIEIVAILFLVVLLATLFVVSSRKTNVSETPTDAAVADNETETETETETESETETETETETESETESESESDAETESESEAETEEDISGKTISPYTGLYIDSTVATQRPIAIMLSNIKQAVPQSGISYADIIYEAPVEGGITRLMGIFQDYMSLTKIGSCRSCRLYYAEIAVEYDAIYAHYGQSDYALSFLNSSAIDNLSGTAAVGSTVYYRTSDRVAPHNAYTSASGLLAGAKQMGYSTTINPSSASVPFSFVSYGQTATVSGGGQASKVSISYSHNSPWFTYDSSTGKYLRYQFGSAQVDNVTGTQLSVTNIIIQFVSSAYQSDNYTLDLTMTGSGSGYYVTGGKYEPITWIRSSVSAVTTYYASDGSELKMTPGKTWVCIVQSSAKSGVTFN